MKTIIITGFLGSGKTELLKNIISSYKGKNIYVIENEIAEYGIDGKIFGANVIEINHGSISGVNLPTFKRVIKDIVRKDSAILIIETSGASDLNPVIMALKYINIKPYVLSVIDAYKFLNVEKLSKHTLNHIENSSAVILNKTDMVNDAKVKILINNLKHLNKNVMAANHCKIDISSLLNSIMPVDIASTKKKINLPHMIWKIKNNLGIKTKDEPHEDINAYVFERYGIIDIDSLKRFLINNNIMRAKGFICSGKGYYFNFVNQEFSLNETKVPDGMNRIVIIGNNTFSKRNTIRKSLNGCLKKKFHHSLNNIIHLWKGQQKITPRVNYLS